jgi:membrane protein YqaA with SNARE-associated domain
VSATEHDEPEVGSSADGAAEPKLNVRKLTIQTVLSVLVVMVTIGSLAYAFKEPLTGASRIFVEAFGAAGVGLGFYAVDAFTLPIPNDSFTAAALLGGAPFLAVIIWGSVGSVLGGMTAWLIGLALRRTAWLKSFMDRRGAEATALVRKYGAVALAFAALTPVPYSVAAYACGAWGMSLRLFVLVSLLRPVRVTIYAAAIMLGLIPSGV